MADLISDVLVKNSLIFAMFIVGFVTWVSYLLSKRLSNGRIHGSALAIVAGLLLAYMGGVATGGTQGLADIEIFAGIGVLGGAMFRDFALVATSFGIHLDEVKRSGIRGGLSRNNWCGSILCCGRVVALAFGYTDPVDISTIGAGAATYIVGPVTGAALGAGSDIIALSIAAGLVKSILVMTTTPLVAKRIGLNNPQSAMVFGGLMGTTSGVAGGLAATDPKLVPYGAMTATFYTGVGCLLAPSILFFAVKYLVG